MGSANGQIVLYIHDVFEISVLYVGILRKQSVLEELQILQSQYAPVIGSDPRSAFMMLLRNLMAEDRSKCCGSRTISFV